MKGVFAEMRLLELKDVYLYYRTSKGPVRAVDGVSFTVEKGETLALVGESGCGKTSTASALTRVLPKNVHRYEGVVRLNGDNIMEYDDETFRKKVRWKKISTVFQGAMNTLSPTTRVGLQVAEPVIIHYEAEKEEALTQAEEALRSVGLGEYIMKSYPHELSGGMKQRVVIATALIMKPSIVILDEPTSALDIMTQANIINLLKRLKREEDLSYIFITHDLALASELADKVAIMYAGRIAEIGHSEQIYRNPRHPYTQLLLKSVPKLTSEERPTSIKGIPPDLIDPPDGCRFHPRCPYAFEKCTKEPQYFTDGTAAACWLLEGRERTSAARS